MNSLEGYTTNGHEYRKSEIDRSNTRRLKWMMNEARKNVELNDSKNNEDKQKYINNLNGKVAHENTNSKQNNTSSNMFNPNVNSFAKFNKNFK